MLEATQKQKNNEQNNESYIFQKNLLGEPQEMKNITLRKDGRYMIRLQKHKKIFTDYAKTEKQAQTKLKNLKQALKNKTVKQTKYTFYEWLDYWYENFKKPFVKQNSNIPLYIANIKQHFPNLKLENYTTESIQKIMNTYKMSRTKELIFLYLNASFQKAIELQIITHNPCNAVVKDRKINNKRIAFTFDEQVKIINAIKGTDIERDIYIYLFTGMRKNEYKPNKILNDLDITNNTLKIESEKKRSEKPIYRIVDLTPAMIRLIQTQPKHKQLTTQYIYLHFKQILKNLGINGGIHTLRHTFATNYYYIGIPDKLRSVWLGHEKVDMTQDIYTNIDRSISKEKLINLYKDLIYQI